MQYLSPHPSMRVADVREVFAAAVARSRTAVADEVHDELARQPVWVRREWALRDDIPQEVMRRALRAEHDWVVRTRLLGAASIPFEEAARAAGRGGPRSWPVLALRADCPDEIGAEMLTRVPERRWVEVYYALVVAVDRETRLRRRPRTVETLLRDPSTYLECGLTAQLLADDSSREVLVGRVVDGARGRWGRFAPDGLEYAFDHLYHLGLTWLTPQVSAFHDDTYPGVFGGDGCVTCEFIAKPARPFGLSWHAPSATAVMGGALSDVVGLYGRASGDVMTALLSGSRTTSFIRVLECVGRLSGDPLVWDLLDRHEQAMCDGDGGGDGDGEIGRFVGDPSAAA